MSKHDLRARPIYHHKRESIEAHLTIVFAALAVTRWIENQHRLVDQEVRPHRPPLPHHAIRAGDQLLTAEDPLPADLRDALAGAPTDQVRTKLIKVRLNVGLA